MVCWSEGGEETAGEGGNAAQIDDDEEDEEEVSEDCTSLHLGWKASAWADMCDQRGRVESQGYGGLVESMVNRAHLLT